MRWMVMYEYEVPVWNLDLSSTKLPRPRSPWESSPSRKNPHGRTGNRIRDLMISSQKRWPLNHEAGRISEIFTRQYGLPTLSTWRKIYENMDLLLKAKSYSKCGWKICGDLKDIGLFLGLHSVHAKFCCFLCEWESRAKDKHYEIKDWPMWEKSIPGE
jgi:hypothetical protein